jgi:hypothetical protein
VESILILVGVVSLLSIVALRQDLADAASNSGLLLTFPVDCSPYMTKPAFSARSSAPGSGTGFFWAT